jgi:hypothetical protein
MQIETRDGTTVVKTTVKTRVHRLEIEEDEINRLLRGIMVGWVTGQLMGAKNVEEVNRVNRAGFADVKARLWWSDLAGSFIVEVERPLGADEIESPAEEEED